MDVARDGIAVYEADETELHQPKLKTHGQAYEMAKEYFKEWLPEANGLLKMYRSGMEDGILM